MQASSGETDEFGSELRSDVLTNGGIINDNGQVEFVLAMKDPTFDWTDVSQLHHHRSLPRQVHPRRRP